MAILTFAEDFSSNIELDSTLMGTPDSGLYWNRGVHPVVTIDNISMLLLFEEIDFNAWDNAVQYGVFSTTRKRSDVVVYDGNVYESISANVNKQPDVSPEWLLTNIESLRIKALLWATDDNFKGALKLTRSLIESQFIYNVGENIRTLSGDYLGWAFEPKDSDYVKIRINQIAFQANTDVQQSLYVINQGRLIDTLTLNPNNGILSFEDVGYTISGKGKFLFVFENIEVVADSVYNDPLKYDGFVCYPVSGIGDSPQAAEYNMSEASNGLNFNVSCYLDSSLYIENNEINLAKFKQTQFELDVINMIIHNPNSTSSRQQRILNEDDSKLLVTHALNDDMLTVARKYKTDLKDALTSINRTFDKFLKPKARFTTKRGVL